MLNIHVTLIMRVFVYAIIAFFLVDYLQCKQTKLKSFCGYILTVWIINALLTLSTMIVSYKALPFEPDLIHSITYILQYVVYLSAFYLGAYISFNVNFLKNLFIAVSVAVLGFLSEAVSVSIILMFNDMEALEGMKNPAQPIEFLYVMVGSFSVIFFTIFCSLFFRIVGRKTINWKSQNKFITTIFLSLIFLYCTFLSNLIYYLNPFSSFYQVLIIIMPVAIIALFLNFLYVNNKRHELELKSNYAEQLNAVQSRHITEITDQNMQIMRLKHDFKAHFNIIHTLAKDEKYNELIHYVSEFIENYSFDPIDFSSRGALNAILSNKYQIAKSKGIDIQIFINDSNTSKISDVDLCSIISNLLQNGIEASESTENKFIKLFADTKANYFIITQINSSSKPNMNFETSKSNREEHGFGLKIIEDFSKRYEGDATFSFEDNVFTSTIMLKIE